MLAYIYTLLALVTGGSVLFKGHTYPGIAGVVGPILCVYAAAGLKGSLLVGTTSQKWGGLGAALVFLMIGLGIVYQSGFGVVFFGYSLSGPTWCFVGLVVGWVSATREMAEEPSG